MNRSLLLFAVTVALNTAWAADPATGNAEAGRQLWTTEYGMKNAVVLLAILPTHVIAVNTSKPGK